MKFIAASWLPTFQLLPLEGFLLKMLLNTTTLQQHYWTETTTTSCI